MTLRLLNKRLKNPRSRNIPAPEPVTIRKGMINICTTSDKNYLLKGLSLYSSLKKTLGRDFWLHYLCLDDECFNTLKKLRLQNVVYYKLSDLEANDAELVALKKSGHVSQFGSPEANYIWALTPYFINHILNNVIKKGEKLMYADSDIYFYLTPKLIFDAVANKSVGIHTHRFGGNKKTSVSGWYNVGVMIFTNDNHGKHISDKWKFWVMNPNPEKNEYYKEYGLCGDQKYVELFVKLWNEHVCVFDEGTAISHRAPWCVEDDHRPVFFYHFSHFTYSTKQKQWSDSLHGEWKPAQNAHILPYYENYFQEILKAHELVKSTNK